jgi:hypothetical protein
MAMRVKTTWAWLGAAMLGAAAGAAGCSSQSGVAPRAQADVGGAQAVAAGTRLTVGQENYTMPALPASASAEPAPYALTGDETGAGGRTPDIGQGANGRWIEAGQGRVYIPAAP